MTAPTGTANSAAIVVACGPGEKEIVRLRDLIESVATLEPKCTHAIVIDDPKRGEMRDVAAGLGAIPDPGPELVVIPHPGHIPEEGWSSGLAMGLLTGHAWVQANTDADFVLKLDTDSLIIGPFVERVSELFTTRDSIGMVGSGSLDYHGNTRDHVGGIWMHRIHNLLQPIWIRHKRETGWFNTVKLGWDADGKYVRKMVRLALDNPGYTAPDSCQGGGYAIHRRLLDAMRDAGDLDRATAWRQTFLAEDILQGIIAGARRFEQLNACGPGEVFGVEWKGLPAPPQELLETGCAVIHSLRQNKDHTEEELREFFQSARRARRASAT